MSEVEILDVVALSPLQRGLYSVSSMAQGIDPYLVTFAVRVENLADPAGLRAAFDGVLGRYPHLGAAVLAEDVPHPVLVITSEGRIGWREVDLRSAPDPEAAARDLYWQEARRRLDLDRGPLFRVVAARVGERDYELVCTAHHIVVDGWSIPLLFSDLIALHRGEGAALPPAPPLREHAAWLASRDTEASARAWTAALDGLAPMPMLGPPAPADLDLPVVGEARVDAAGTDLLLTWARAHGLTLNTVLQMAWARILSGITGRDDVVFGQTTSGRDASLPNAERLVGALVTTIPVRVRMDDRAPAQVGAELQRSVARLRAHEYLGIAEITRHAGAGQLFDSLLVFENSPVGAVAPRMPMGGGATMTARRVDSPSHYPLAVVPVLEHGELICRVETRPDLLTTFDPDRMARRLLAVATRIVTARRCSAVDVLLEDEPAALTDDDAGGASRASSAAGSAQASPSGAASSATVPEALLNAADAAADRIAVVDATGEHTFLEFGSAVRTLAAELAAAGIGSGDAVAVMLPRDRRVLHAPFAVGLAGATCVHVDPATPADRVAYLLSTSGARIVLADADRADALAEVRAQGVDCRHAIPDTDGSLVFPAADAIDLAAAHGWPGSGETRAARPVPPCRVPASERNGVSSRTTDIVPQRLSDAPFYVVFTSGTTGRPKGVAISHRALLNHWANHERRIFAPIAAATGRTLRIGHGWSTGFDAAWQPTVALLSGHTVVLLGDEVRTDAERIVGAIGEFGIDIFDTSPSMLNRLIAAGLFRTDPGTGAERCPLAVLALGGEAISPDTWRRLRGLATTRVINFYGPTETTVEALMADVHDHAAPTIGRPFDGMTAEVLDHRLRPVPPGGQGELYLSGPQLALGYLGRPAATAAAFVAGNDGGRRYRTGDLVRRADDGTVAYEGRVDRQVKINGYRVEPDEVSVVLRELDGVRHAAALAFTENGRTRLGALVVGDGTVARVRSALARRLPQFLVPTRIVFVDEIPLNRNDKLDVHVATELLARPAETGARAEPRTETERTLLALIEAMSAGAGTRIGILDSLVDLGIDSIGVIDLVSRLRGAGYRISAREVLAAADLRDLAACLDDPSEDVPGDAGVTPAGTVLPLTDLALEILGYGDYRYLAQSQVLSLDGEITPEAIVRRLEELATAHPTLRSRLETGADGRPVLIAQDRSSAAASFVVAEPGESPSAADYLAATVQRLDPDAGRMVAATLVPGDRPRLVLSIHHLAVDVVSWLILVDDLRRLDQGVDAVNESGPERIADSGTRAALGIPPTLGTPLGGRYTDPRRDRAGKAIQRMVELGPDDTEALLARCAENDVPLDDLLLTACARLVADTADATGRIAVTRESHGRDPGDDTRRVGWFTVEETALVPVSELETWTPAAGRAPVHHRTLNARGQIRLNHLGRFDMLHFGSGPWTPVPLPDLTAEFGVAGHPDLPLRFTIDLNTAVVAKDSRPVLIAHIDVNSAVLDEAGADARAERWRAVLCDFASGMSEVSAQRQAG
ncbi:non-ribosomal peptide synthetase [Nocardia africana]|uniref:Linear gramicidin synthase subunit D n=1 Tax=Nocardia africana TaxID=134964 RepID=A0A378WMF5_9NOCA|nr:AMP-binding protein [Nocardia africana]MCC3315903.1 AMP-binding protein [Nocardia africana]SUA41765.1 Linear gramicidin synthase subunit D [Nocardia africana]